VRGFGKSRLVADVARRFRREAEVDGEEVGPVRPGDFIQRPRISFDFAAEFRSPLDVKDVAVGPPVFTFASPGPTGGT